MEILQLADLEFAANIAGSKKRGSKYLSLEDMATITGLTVGQAVSLPKLADNHALKVKHILAKELHGNYSAELPEYKIGYNLAKDAVLIAKIQDAIVASPDTVIGETN